MLTPGLIWFPRRMEWRFEIGLLCLYDTNTAYARTKLNNQALIFV